MNLLDVESLIKIEIISSWKYLHLFNLNVAY
jgi:hypothetical protein